MYLVFVSFFFKYIVMISDYTFLINIIPAYMPYIIGQFLKKKLKFLSVPRLWAILQQLDISLVDTGDWYMVELIWWSKVYHGRLFEKSQYKDEICNQQASYHPG
jgi:hypothetical protein